MRIRCGEFRSAVRLDRTTFERLIAPHVDRTVDALCRTIASAGVEPSELTALLLVGGSARMPLVARTVTEQLGRVPTVRGRRGPGRARRRTRAFRTDRRGRRRGADDVRPCGHRRRRSMGKLPRRGTAGEELSRTSAETSRRWCSPSQPWRTNSTTPLFLGRRGGLLNPESGGPADIRRAGTRGRTAAVLDAGGDRAAAAKPAPDPGRRGAVIVAALVLVALFRPDGPLGRRRSRGRERRPAHRPCRGRMRRRPGCWTRHPAGVRTDVDADTVSTVRPQRSTPGQSVATRTARPPSSSDLPGDADPDRQHPGRTPSTRGAAAPPYAAGAPAPATTVL